MEQLEALLQDKDELATLIILTEKDPLGIEAATRTWLREQCVMIDARALSIRARTWAASRRLDLSEFIDLEDLVRTSIERSALALHEEDASRLRDAEPEAEPLELRFQVVVRRLRIEPRRARAACFALNNLPDDERAAVYSMLILGGGFTGPAMELGLSAREAHALLVRGLSRMIAQIEAGGDRSDDNST